MIFPCMLFEFGTFCLAIGDAEQINQTDKWRRVSATSLQINLGSRLVK